MSLFFLLCAPRVRYAIRTSVRSTSVMRLLVVTQWVPCVFPLLFPVTFACNPPSPQPHMSRRGFLEAALLCLQSRLAYPQPIRARFRMRFSMPSTMGSHRVPCKVFR